jgi:hypothetical protein
MACFRQLHHAIIARDSGPHSLAARFVITELESRGRCASLIYLLALVDSTKR